MAKKGGNMYVPPVIIEEMEDIMKEENLTIKTEALRKVASYSKLGRKIKNRVDVNDLDDIIPQIPIGKKLKFKDVINL